MHIQKKKTIFSLSLSLMALLIEKETCQSLENKQFYEDYFEKGTLVIPKRPNPPKQDWDKKPQEKVNEGNIGSVKASVTLSGAKDMRTLFHYNEYGRD